MNAQVHHIAVNLTTDCREKRHSLQKLAKLHADLVNADKKWMDAVTAARKVRALIARLDEFWWDLPQNREPVLQAFEKAGLLMKFIIMACDNDKPLNQSFAARKQVQEALDDLCTAITRYREAFQDG